MRTPTTHPLRFVARLVALLVVLAALPATLLAQNVVFGPGLQSTLQSMNPADQLTVVVTFEQDGPLTGNQVDAIEALGITQGITFQSLPIAGVLATSAQVQALAGLDGVLSIWPNEQQTFFNKDSRDLTGVEKLRTDPSLRNAMGVPFSGKGVTVVVNDSGVDATHADLEYGSHVVENVQGLTNLNAVSGLLPITYTEGQLNTDTNSGHGTHVAGTVAGTGVRSGGKYEGVAPGADLVGYGSGAVILLLDTIGGFDYAITHQFSFRNPIRVVTNSWGTSGTFNPANPVNVATYQTYKRGIVVTFAAGNEGSGEDTHNPYAIAPWVISVGAGTKQAGLAGFSSRGLKGQTFTFTTPDGVAWTAVNEPAVVAPGVDIISTRAVTNGSANGGDADLEAIEPAFVPFYTMISGTSMATPHVAGIVALMLEANPTLSPMAVKDKLMASASNMPGREDWEVGAGYVNAYAAVVSALGLREDFGATRNDLRTFNSNAALIDGGSLDFSLFFSPVGDTDSTTFYVGPNVSTVKARAVVPDNTVAIVLTDPAGNRYGSGITLPILGEIAGVSAPGRQGMWSITVRGIGSISGVAVDPLRVTNGTALPGIVEGTIRFVETAGFTGLSDVDGHPAQGFIEQGVGSRLVDGRADGTFGPDDPLTRADLAEYLVMGAGLRQSLPLNGGFTFGSHPRAPFIEAAAAQGGALKDRAQTAAPVIRTDGGTFDPTGSVSRVDLAYALMQSYGLEDVAAGFSGDVVATYNGERIVLDDQDAIPADLKGYVQLALDTGVLFAYFSLEQGPFEPFPTLHAAFRPNETVTRAAYAVAATRFLDAYESVDSSAFEGGTGNRTFSADEAAAEAFDAGVPEGFELAQNYPNPFNPATRIQFTLPEAAPVRLAVYDLLGRRVRVLLDGGALSAGTHAVTFEASDLASGTYLYRLETPNQTFTRRMVLLK